MIYVLILWFYEGDSNLVNSFKGVYSTYDEAKANCKLGTELLTELIISPDGKIKPLEWGQYGDDCKYEIRECQI